MDYWRHGTTDGASEQKLWNKKAKNVNATECMVNSETERTELMWNDKKCESVCAELLKSTTKTNEAVDNIAGMNEEDKESVKPHSHDTVEDVRPEL